MKFKKTIAIEKSHIVQTKILGIFSTENKEIPLIWSKKFKIIMI